jgi:nucleotide-binding universal stress UspA family protein
VAQTVLNKQSNARRRALRRRMMAPTITRILVPTDFSETADAALAYARALAPQLGASLHLVHVFSDPYVLPAYAPDVYAEVPAVLREEALRQVDDELKKRADAHRGVPIVTATAIGLTAKELVRYADEHGIDLIVMGTHGRHGVAHLLLGSVAEYLVRIAPCPVLTVRGPVARALNPTTVRAMAPLVA